jgi:hypothetical protein
VKKIFIFSLMLLLIPVACFSQNSGQFVPILNGKDLTGWTLEKPGGFEVVDGEMITRSFGAGNDIFTKKSYGNFILQLEFLLSEVGNSGVFIRYNPDLKVPGVEVQLLAPWTPWRDDLHCTGSLYGHVAVTSRPDETTGKWYKMEIRCDRNLITVSVDGKVTTIARIDTVKSMKDLPFQGVIGFQGNHATKQGQYAKFRDINIRDLDAEPEYVKPAFYEKNAQLRNLAFVSAVSIGAGMVDPLAVIMSENDPAAKSGAKDALFNIVAKASDPQATVKVKNDVKVALKNSIKNTSDNITKNYLKWLSGMLRK